MLKLKNVVKTFNPGTVNERTALDNVSLEVKKGDFISIIGANGAGKSTLFGAIGGSFFTDSGVIVLDGEDSRCAPSICARAISAGSFRIRVSAPRRI